MNHDKLYSLIGSLVEEKRKFRNWTQQALSEEIGLSRTSVVNIERGKQRTPLHTIYDIAKALRVEPFELLPPMKALDLDADSVQWSIHLRKLGLSDSEIQHTIENMVELKQKQ